MGIGRFRMWEGDGCVSENSSGVCVLECDIWGN